MDSKWERVIDYINIDIKTASEMMKAVQPGKMITGLKLVKKGLRNSNYIVDYSNAKFLLRVYGTKDDWWEKEKSVYEFVRSRVRVPELVYFNSDFSIITRPYAVFEYIDGITLDEYMFQDGNCSDIIAETGMGLAQIHQCPYSEVGFLNNDMKVVEKLPPLELWYDMFLSEKTAKKLGSNLTAKVRDYIGKNGMNIQRIEEMVAFVHNDFRPINIIIDRFRRPYFIDWEGAMAGHVLGDIGQFLRFEEQVSIDMEKIFIESYNNSADKRLPRDYRELGRLRDLINLLQMLDSDHILENKDRDLINIVEKTCNI